MKRLYLNIKCQYGCGNNANHILNNGKYCCKKYYQSCPAVIKRVSNSLKGKGKKKASLKLRICSRCLREFPNVGSVANHMKVCKGADVYDEIRKLYRENERLEVLRKRYGRKIVQYALKGIKRNFSDVMKRAHKEGRSCSWSKKRSYAEKLFEKFLNNIGFRKNKDYYTEYRFFLFRADFYFPNKKLVIEIDGQQHFRYNHQMEIDRRKNMYLNERGIDVIRITWKELYHDAIRFFSILDKGFKSERFYRNALFDGIEGIKVILKEG